MLSSALFCRHPVVGIDTEYQSLCQDLGLPEGERKRAWDSDSSHFMLSSALFCRHPVVGIDTEYQSLCQDLGLPEGERKRAWELWQVLDKLDETQVSIKVKRKVQGVPQSQATANP